MFGEPERATGLVQQDRAFQSGDEACHRVDGMDCDLVAQMGAHLAADLVGFHDQVDPSVRVRQSEAMCDR